MIGVTGFRGHLGNLLLWPKRLFAVSLIGLLAMFHAAPLSAQEPCDLLGLNQDKITRTSAGTGCFEFDAWQGPAIPVYLYIPREVDVQTAPVAIIMHGARRDADRYRDEWKAEADKHGFIVAAPGFFRSDFPRSANYNLGNMRDPETGEWREKEQWSFAAIEGVFDALKAKLDGKQAHYTLYGHSAGSQFVHRSLLFMPGLRVKRYLPANAGWYTFPDLETTYPFGLKGTGVGEQELQAALAKDVVILLGDQDTDPEGRSLNRSAGAMAQGAHRFARGKAFYAAAKALAHDKGWEFGWSLRVIEGVAHSNGGMAKAASDLIE